MIRLRHCEERSDVATLRVSESRAEPSMTFGHASSSTGARSQPKAGADKAQVDNIRNRLCANIRFLPSRSNEKPPKAG